MAMQQQHNNEQVKDQERMTATAMAKPDFFAGQPSPKPPSPMPDKKA